MHFGPLLVCPSVLWYLDLLIVLQCIVRCALIVPPDSLKSLASFDVEGRQLITDRGRRGGEQTLIFSNVASDPIVLLQCWQFHGPAWMDKSEDE